MDDSTVAVYDANAATYAEHRNVRDPEPATVFATTCPPGRRLDLGCGPGLYFSLLGTPLIGIDASWPMLHLADERRLAVPLAQADQERLPFRRGSFTGVWANKCLQHVAAEELPMVLHDIHRALDVGGRFAAELFSGNGTFVTDGDLPGRRFTLWNPDELTDLLIGAGFADIEVHSKGSSDSWTSLLVTARRSRTLADTVGGGMRLLVCGLNPSLPAADAGVGFAGPTNRFWRALHDGGISSVDRDAVAVLRRDHIGMTDLVKRATRAASELSTADYRLGMERLSRLVRRTHPAAVCVVGLAGWRAAVDRHARPGWQPTGTLDAPVYVMPSTSGLNAGTSLDELTAHLRRAAQLD